MRFTWLIQVLLSASIVIQMSLILLIASIVNGNFINNLDKTINIHNNIIMKKSLNHNSRLLFVAGLEGTGHHAMRDFFDICLIDDPKKRTKLKSKSSSNNLNRCEMETEMSRMLMEFNTGNDNRMDGIFGMYVCPYISYSYRVVLCCVVFCKYSNSLSLSSS